MTLGYGGCDVISGSEFETAGVLESFTRDCEAHSESSSQARGFNECGWANHFIDRRMWTDFAHSMIGSAARLQDQLVR